MIRHPLYEHAVVRQSARAEEARRLAELYEALGDGAVLARHQRQLEAGFRELARQIEAELIVEAPERR